MKKLFLLASGLLLGAMIAKVSAAPSEVLSDVSIVQEGGVDAVRVDFAIPVRYVSHTPESRGKQLTIFIRFDVRPGLNTSELPLLQTLFAPEEGGGPLVDVVYETVGGEPRVQLNFNTEVNYSVSQALGFKSLLVMLTDSRAEAQADPAPIPSQSPPEPPPQTPSQPPPLSPLALSDEQVGIRPPADAPDTETDIKARKLMDDGRKAMRSAKYTNAIQIFSAVLSLPHNKFSEPALELLGVARERNNQQAQANAVYSQYLQLYPDGEGAVRVRQRQAELLAAQLKPQPKLKEGPRAEREGDKKISSTFIGNLAQYYDYGDTVTEVAGREVQYQTLDTQLSMSWRVRGEDWEVYNYFFGDYDYDIDENSDEVEISSAYSRIKHRNAGVYATLGRQVGGTAGVLGRFDGVYLGYDVLPKIRLNGVWGYPVDIFNKQTIQTNKPLVGISVDFIDFVKGLDASPYWTQQEVDGITDRTAVGAEVRFFRPKFNVFSQVDYDILYSDLNIFYVQAQVVLRKPTSMLFTFDYRNYPFLETSNALLQVDEDVTIGDLLDGSKTINPYTESELQGIAKDRTGTSMWQAINLSHTFNPRQQVTVELSRLEQTFKFVNFTNNDPTTDDVLRTPATSETTEQWRTSLQWVSNTVFTAKDTAINFLRFTLGDTFNEYYYSLAYRIPYRTLLTTEPRIYYRFLDNDRDETLSSIVPGVRINYRPAQKLQFYLELNYEISDFGGESQQQDFQMTNGYMGYNWTF